MQELFSDKMSGGMDMSLEVYYRLINSGIGKKIKEVLNGLVPGLIPEPIPVREPERNRRNSRNAG